MPRAKKPTAPQLAFVLTREGFVCDVPRSPDDGRALVAP